MLTLHPYPATSIAYMARQAAKIAKHRASLPATYLDPDGEFKFNTGWFCYNTDHDEAVATRIDGPHKSAAWVDGHADEQPGLIRFMMGGVPITCYSVEGTVDEIAEDMVAQYKALTDPLRTGLVLVGTHAWVETIGPSRQRRSIAAARPEQEGEAMEIDVGLEVEAASKLARLMMVDGATVMVRGHHRWVESLFGPDYDWTLVSATMDPTDDWSATLTFKATCTARPAEVDNRLTARPDVSDATPEPGRSREDLLAMIEQTRQVCERRTSERDDARSELARLRDNARLGAALATLAEQHARLRANPCPTMKFGFSVTAAAEALRSEIDEVEGEQVRSAAAHREIGGMLSAALHFAKAHETPLVCVLEAEGDRLRARMDLVATGVTWAEAKAMESQTDPGAP